MLPLKLKIVSNITKYSYIVGVNKVFAAKPHTIDGRDVDIKGAVSKSAQGQRNE